MTPHGQKDMLYCSWVVVVVLGHLTSIEWKSSVWVLGCVEHVTRGSIEIRVHNKCEPPPLTFEKSDMGTGQTKSSRSKPWFSVCSVHG